MFSKDNCENKTKQEEDMLFAGREVRIGKTVLKIEGIVLPNSAQPCPVNNVFIFSLLNFLERNFYVEF